MLAIIVVTLLLTVGVSRLPALVLAVLCLVAFVAVEPALLASSTAAFVLAGVVLTGGIRWMMPAVTVDIKPVRVMWITPRFTLALAYA